MKSPEDYAPGYEFRPAWRLNDAAIEADAIAFWQRLGILPAGVSAADRAKQLVAAAYEDGALVAVMTAELAVLEQVRTRLAMIRGAVDPAHRRSNVNRAVAVYVYELLRQWSAEHPEEKVGGLGAIIENKGLITTDYGRSPYWRESGFILAGYTRDGRQIRISWFKDFRLPAY